MGLGNWIKKQLGAIALATSAVEQNALSQGGDGELSSGTNQERRHRQGTLSDALSRGEITQEVKDLRWRMYKVLDATEKFENEKTIKIVGYEEDGITPILETVASRKVAGMSKIKLDEHDDYPLELVVNNDEITLGAFLDDVKEHSREDIEKTIIIEIDENGKQFGQATIGEISKESHDSSNKPERVISCIRESRPRFEIEKFTKKMNVRTISETEKLLEFYVSIYPDEFNKKTRLFISEIKKTMVNPRIGDFLDISSVEFVSYNTLGINDLHDFEYKITKFDKLIEFDGYYVVKFKAEVIKDGISLIEQYREAELDEKYKNIERRKGR